MPIVLIFKRSFDLILKDWEKRFGNHLLACHFYNVSHVFKYEKSLEYVPVNTADVHCGQFHRFHRTRTPLAI